MSGDDRAAAGPDDLEVALQKAAVPNGFLRLVADGARICVLTRQGRRRPADDSSCLRVASWGRTTDESSAQRARIPPRTRTRLYRQAPCAGARLRAELVSSAYRD